MSTQLQSFTPNHRDWIIACLATGCTYRQIADMLPDKFDEFKNHDLTDDEFYRVVSNRIRSHLYSKTSNWRKWVDERKEKFATVSLENVFRYR